MYVELTDEQKAAQVRFSQSLPRSVPRYQPMSPKQEQRLLTMLNLDEKGLFYPAIRKTDFAWMLRLEARGLVEHTDTDFWLTPAGVHFAEGVRVSMLPPF